MKLSDEQIKDKWILRGNIHDGDLMLQLIDFARAIESAALAEVAPCVDIDPHDLACALAVCDGYDPDDGESGLFDLQWSRGHEPEILGDIFNIEYLAKAERIIALLATPTDSEVGK